MRSNIYWGVGAATLIVGLASCASDQSESGVTNPTERASVIYAPPPPAPSASATSNNNAGSRYNAFRDPLSLDVGGSITDFEDDDYNPYTDDLILRSDGTSAVARNSTPYKPVKTPYRPFIPEPVEFKIPEKSENESASGNIASFARLLAAGVATAAVAAGGGGSQDYAAVARAYSEAEEKSSSPTYSSSPTQSKSYATSSTPISNRLPNANAVNCLDGRDGNTFNTCRRRIEVLWGCTKSKQGFQPRVKKVGDLKGVVSFPSGSSVGIKPGSRYPLNVYSNSSARSCSKIGGRWYVFACTSDAPGEVTPEATNLSATKWNCFTR